MTSFNVWLSVHAIGMIDRFDYFDIRLFNPPFAPDTTAYTSSKLRIRISRAPVKICRRDFFLNERNERIVFGLFIIHAEMVKAY